MVSVVHFLKGYRTVLVNAVIALVGVLTAFGVVPIDQLPSAETLTANFDAVIGGVAVIVAGVNFVLRMVTSTPVGKSE